LTYVNICSISMAMIQTSDRSRTVSNWLLLCCAMIFFMVIIGGITRLTESGLSITEWKPITGAIPPMNDQEWAADFEKYKQIPEYQTINKGMSLDAYKKIYFWEYLHRLWGRLIGLVFFAPMVFFWMRGYLRPEWKKPLLGIFILGAAQGFMGWFMVQSGLSQNVDVSQYRLTAHLSLAALIYAACFWMALRIRAQSRPSSEDYFASGVWPLWPLMTMFILVFAMGGFMAGTDAGLLYQTYPTYNGLWLPDGLLAASPWWINIFENTTTIHFLHRTLAILFIIAVWIYGVRLWRQRPPRPVKVALIHVMVMSLLQTALGIAAIATKLHLHVAVTHQAGGIIMLTFLLWLGFALSRYAAKTPRAT